MMRAVLMPFTRYQNNFANTYLGGILIGVAFLNAFIEFYQLQKSEAILASFLAMIPPSCRVVRNDAITTIPAADLVKGDVVFLVCCPLSISFMNSKATTCFSASETRHLQILSCLQLQTSRLTIAV